MPKYFGVEVSNSQLLAEDGKPAYGRDFDRYDYADYILPQGELGAKLAITEHVMYEKALRVEPAGAGKEEMPVIAPLFYRTAEHFCSHRQAPSSGERESAAVISTENTVYFAHPIFSLYRKIGAPWFKQLVVNAIDRLLGQRIITHNGPNTMEVTVNRRQENGALIVHALHYVPVAKAKMTDIVDTLIPLTNVDFWVKTDKPARSVTKVPQRENLPFKTENGITAFTMDRLEGHQMIEIGI
jgi:hypothetical protein